MTKLRDYVAKGKGLGGSSRRGHNEAFGAVLRNAMPVNHELEMIKQNTKTQAEAYLLETE